IAKQRWRHPPLNTFSHLLLGWVEQAVQPGNARTTPFRAVILSAGRGSVATKRKSKAVSPAPGLPDWADFAQSGMAVSAGVAVCWGGKDPENPSHLNADSGSSRNKLLAFGA